MKFLVQGNEDAAFSDAHDHGRIIAGHRKLIGLLGRDDQPLRSVVVLEGLFLGTWELNCCRAPSDELGDDLHVCLRGELDAMRLGG